MDLQEKRRSIKKAGDDHEIRADEEYIYIYTYFLYSIKAAEALTSRAPDG
jgi:hypothetical protein